MRTTWRDRPRGSGTTTSSGHSSSGRSHGRPRMAGSGRLATIRMAMATTLAARSARCRGPRCRRAGPSARRDLDAVGAAGRGRRRRARSRTGAGRARPRSANPAPAARRATTSTDPSGCSRTKARVSSSTWAQRRPPRRRATCARRSRARSAYAVRVVRSHSSRRCHGIVRRESSPLTPSSPISSPAKSIGTPGRRELQPRRDPVHRRVTAHDGADPGGVVGAEDVPARRRSPASRACPARRGGCRRPRAPPRRGTGTGRPNGARRRGRVAQPRPHRPGEAGVVHRAVPAVAVDVAGRVVVVLADDPRVLAQLGGGARARPARPRAPRRCRPAGRSCWRRRCASRRRRTAGAASGRPPSAGPRPSRAARRGRRG